MPRVACILNPNARDGLSVKQWDQFEPALRLAGFDIDLHRTQAPGHAMDIAEGLCEGDHDLVVAVGGGAVYVFVVDVEVDVEVGAAVAVFVVVGRARDVVVVSVVGVVVVVVVAAIYVFVADAEVEVGTARPTGRLATRVAGRGGATARTETSLAGAWLRA